ncbi:MAG: hypothetical protein E6J79_10250 [Deltaproteobacteria bacterium]|nr:MAG: hypothetical protein E6J79_10250 [Deltaproteobacteria bacterium]
MESIEPAPGELLLSDTQIHARQEEIDVRLVEIDSGRKVLERLAQVEDTEPVGPLRRAAEGGPSVEHEPRSGMDVSRHHEVEDAGGTLALTTRVHRENRVALGVASNGPAAGTTREFEGVASRGDGKKRGEHGGAACGGPVQPGRSSG